MKQIIYSHLLIRMAKLLIKYAPAECITSIEISKTVVGLKSMPVLSISHFDRVITPGKFLNGTTEKVDGVEVALRYFGRNEDGQA